MTQVERVFVPIGWHHRCCEPKCKAPMYRADRCRFHYDQKKRREDRAAAEREAMNRHYRPDHPEHCYVYAILSENGLVKFGSSVAPESRFISIQGQSPIRVKLDLLGSVLGGRSLERGIHRFLDSLREHGEWFRYEGAAKAVADLIASGDSAGVKRIVDPRSEP